MNKVSGGICTSREQTSQRTVSMFWPKQMRDRNTSPNARRGKGKEQIVLSTCVGCGLENWPRSCWGHTIKKIKCHIFDHMNSPACQLLWISSCQATETLQTSLLNCFATMWTLPYSQINCTGTLFVIWIASNEHSPSINQKIVLVHNTVGYCFQPPSGLLFCLKGDRAAGLAASKAQELIVPTK